MERSVFEYGDENAPNVPCKVKLWRSAALHGGTPNWHEHVELLHFTAGEGYVLMDNRKCPFRAGDSVIINAQVIHSVYSLRDTEYVIIHFYRWFCVRNGIQTDSISFRENTGPDARLAAEIGNIRRASETDDALRTARINCAALRLLLFLCENYAVGAVSGENSVSFERIKNVMLLLKKDPAAHRTLEEIAAYAGVNKYQLSREFKAVTGKSVFAYINAIRCKEAQRLLMNGSSATQAAFACGFQNLSYFSRTYQKYIGETPTETRRAQSAHRGK